jgi:hypothetical protein
LLVFTLLAGAGCRSDDRQARTREEETASEPARIADDVPCDSDASCAARCAACGERCSRSDAIACYEDGQRKLRAMPPAFWKCVA